MALYSEDNYKFVEFGQSWCYQNLIDSAEHIISESSNSEVVTAASHFLKYKDKLFVSHKFSQHGNLFSSKLIILGYLLENLDKIYPNKQLPT